MGSGRGKGKGTRTGPGEARPSPQHPEEWLWGLVGVWAEKACRGFRAEGASLWAFPKASAVEGSRFLDDFLREKQHSREP